MSASDAVKLVYEKLKGWGSTLILMLPNILLAIVIVIVFTMVSRPVGRLLRRGLQRVGHNEVINSLLSKTVTLAIFLVGLLIALSILDLDRTVTSLLAGVGVLGLALGFAFQDIAANFMAGIMISLQRPCDVGDLVRSGNFTGRVEKISLRSTILRTFQGPLVYIPNKDIIQSPLTNFTRTAERRVELRVGVAYTDDLEKVREVAIEAVQTIACRKAKRDVEVHFEEFGDSSINFVLWMWVDYNNERDFVAARSEAILRIKAAFERTDITIPYPIRTLDFGLRGGEAIRKAIATVEIADAADPRNKWTGSGRAEAGGGDPEGGGQEEDRGGAGDEKSGAGDDEKSGAGDEKG